MEFPVKVALAQAVPTLPDGPGWWYEPKIDGHRTVLRRTDDSVVLYARSGWVVTQHWMDLAVAAMALCPGTVLDGEAAIWRDGKLDFAAAQSRAASSVTRARTLAARYPASYVCWDVLQHPDPAIGDCRPLPYTQRRALLVDLLVGVGPPIQAVRLSARLDPVLAARVGAVLAGAGEQRAAGEVYTRVEVGLVVEVLAGSGRHGTLTVTRMR
ncbi:ATP-dependent DNA ligase [Streptomyces sp. NPDC001274]